MDTVTFELAPLTVRVRAIAVLAVSIALQVIASPLVLKAKGSNQTIAALLLVIFSLGLWARLAHICITTLIGRPVIKRGLFRSKMVVAWKSHLRAQIFTGIVTVLAVYAALDASMRTGGLLCLLAAIVAHVGLYQIMRDRRLAAVQLWVTPMAAPEPVTPAKRMMRPMIDSPLPPPPRIGSDPFRVPPPTARLEDKLVKPTLVTATPEVVASGNSDEPSFLR